MDSFKIPRKIIYLYCSDYRKKLQVWLKKHDPSKEEFVYPWPTESDWKIAELYALEQFYLGESFVCKPTDAYGKFFKEDHKTIADIKKLDSNKTKDKNRVKVFPVKAIIRNFFEFKVKKETSKYYGQSMIKAVIEDRNGEQCTCTIFPDRWKTVQDRIKQVNSKAGFDIGIAFSFSGTANTYEDDVGIILDDLFDIAIAPIVPADLKQKKINLKEAKAKMTQENVEKPSENKNLFEEAEDLLYDEGLIDLEENVND